MERRDWSLTALERLNYLDSLEDQELRARLLSEWVTEHLIENNIEDFDLKRPQLERLSELLFKNINFLKSHRDFLKQSIKNNDKIKEFFN
jgi:hypothetical protein